MRAALPAVGCRAPLAPLPRPTPARPTAQRAGPVPSSVLLAGSVSRPWAASKGQAHRASAASGPVQPEPAEQEPASPGASPGSSPGLSLGWGEDRQPRLPGGFTFEDVYFYLNIVYWSLLLASVLSGNDLLGRWAPSRQSGRRLMHPCAPMRSPPSQCRSGPQTPPPALP